MATWEAERSLLRQVSYRFTMESDQIQFFVDFVLRMVISLALPVWGAVMIALGVAWSSRWWMGCGALVLVVGLLLAVGNPLADHALREL